MMLPHHILWHLDEAPEGNYVPADAVAVPCHHCKHVQLIIRGDLAVGRVKVASNPLETVFLEVWLRCEGSGCGFRPAPVYAQWLPAATAEERKAEIEAWIWDGLRCPQGHPVLNPGWAD
jgi:hypothetical protein